VNTSVRDLGKKELTFYFADYISPHVEQVYLAMQENIVPVTSDYDTFPYVLFRRHSLPEARKNRFTERYIFTSNEFNILNVILSREEGM
jgi:hypothetical protein